MKILHLCIQRANTPFKVCVMDQTPRLWFTRISDDKDKKTREKLTYTQASWDPSTSSPCIGYTRSDGIFEYKDIHTCKSEHYQMFETNHQTAMKINIQYNQFQFLCADYPGFLCFTLEESKKVLSYFVALPISFNFSFVLFQFFYQ